MFVKPAPDPDRPGEVLIVRDPLSMLPIPREGRNVPEINYWHQRVRDKDLIVSEPPVEAAAIEQPMTEIHPEADGSAIFTGDHEAEPAKQE